MSTTHVLDRPAPPPDTTVRYGPLPDHVADVRWPVNAGEGPAPLVLVVHGGFWRCTFDRRHTGPQCVGLAAAGFAVASVEYRRTGQPGGGWPGTLDDVTAAVTAVPDLVGAAASAAGRDVDTAGTVLLGHSAGGHLVAWAAATQHLPHVVGAVALAGVLDLVQAARLGLDPGPGGSAVEALLAGAPGEVPERYAAADPTRLGAPGVPVVAVHGDVDTTVPLSLSTAYTQATRQRLVVLPGVDHLAVIDPRSSAWPRVLAEVRSAARTARR